MAKAKKTTRGASPARPKAATSALVTDRLLGDLRSLIESAREQTARAVNAALVGLYWSIGKRIREDILHEKRAGYGEQIVPTPSARLTQEYGRGFDRRNLFHMIRFAEVFPDETIMNALRTQLSWTHFRELIAIGDPLKRDFHAERFEAAHKGQMELYLRWLEKHDTRPGEDPPLGLILRADKSAEHVELLQLDKSGIRVAQYLTEPPPRRLLEEKLHDAVRLACERLAIAATESAEEDAPKSRGIKKKPLDGPKDETR